MDNLEANSIQIPLNHKGEDPMCKSEETNYSVYPRQVSKKVQQFFFAKFLSCNEDQTLKCRIEELEKLITCMNQEELEIYQKIEAKKIEISNESARIECGVNRERNTRSNIAFLKKKLDLLQQALSKPSFAMNACCEEETNFQVKMNHKNLHFHLLHGANNLAKEKQILRENDNGIQQKGAIVSKLSIEEPMELFWQLYWHCWQWPKQELVWIRQIFEGVKEFQWRKEKSLANATVMAMVWSSLGSKQAIKEKINLTEKESEELRRKNITLKRRIKNAERNFEKNMKKKLISLEKQLEETNERRFEAYKCINILRQQCDDNNTL